MYKNLFKDTKIVQIKPISIVNCHGAAFHKGLLIGFGNYPCMHEFLSPLKLKYSHCRWCDKRSPHICFRCGFCYSCHPKMESIERRKVPANINMNRLIDIENLPLSG
jgi:hypothetical protein